MTLYSSRALTAPELALVRSQGQWSKLSLVIPKSVTMYTARVNQTTFLDPVTAITYDGGSGTLANALIGMTIMFGSAAGLWDHGIARIRSTPSATVFYVNESSELSLIADNDYITVLDEFLPWQRHLAIAGNLALMDYDIVYSSQHANCLPVVNMGTDYILSMASGGTVSITPDASESWVVGSTVASYLWVATGASATSGLDTATPTITYNAAGTYRISCTVTSALSVARTSYRYVYVNPTTTSFELLSCRGDQDSGGWEFSVRCFSGVTLTDVRDRSKAFLVIDSFFNDAAGVLGQIPGAENILCSGWIRDESITVDKEHDTIRFNVSGLAHWLSQETSYPVGIGAVGSAPAAWTEMEDLTVDKGLWHLLEWRSTALNCCDFHPTGNAYLATALEGPLGTLWEQIKNIAYETLLASPTVDRYNRLFVSTSSQYIALASRSTIPTVMTLTSSDWEDPIELERIIIPPATVVDLSGVSVSATFVPTALFSRAPGRTISRLGLVSTQDRLLLESQTQLNVLSGLYLARLNNPYKVIEIKLPHANTLLDISINQYLDLTIAAGDTPRGIVLTNLKIIPTRISYEYDPESGHFTTELECEGSTSGSPGQSYFVPVVPIPGNTPITIPPFTSPGWPILIPGGYNTPPYINPNPITPGGECPTDAPANGPYPLYIYGELSATAGITKIGNLRCTIRTSGHDNKTIYEIHGLFQKLNGAVWEDTLEDSWYTVEARNSAGVIIAVGVHDPVTTPNIRTGVLNAVAASAISYIYITVDEYLLLRPSDVQLSHIDENPFSGNEIFTWENYGSGIQAKALDVYRTGSTIWTGGVRTIAAGVQLYTPAGSPDWPVGTIFKIQSQMWYYNEWVGPGGYGLTNEWFKFQQYRGSLAGASTIWEEDITPDRHVNGGYQWYSGLHSDIFTIPSTITPLANFESVMHVNVSGEMESYKVCFPEILLRIWLMGEGTHRMIVNQANIWNICPPEAV